MRFYNYPGPRICLTYFQTSQKFFQLSRIRGSAILLIYLSRNFLLWAHPIPKCSILYGTPMR